MNNTIQQNTNNFGILANFTRSFDNYHNDNDRIHLISSICLLKENEYINLIDLLGKNRYYSDERLFVFLISPSSSKIVKRESITINDMVIVQLTINELLANLVFTNKTNQTFESIFGGFELKYKDFDVVSSQCIFLFINQIWSNILLNFKIHKIDISGGSTPKRHIVHTVDFKLIRALLSLFKDEKIINKVIYDSYKDPILSSSIPLDFYTKILDSEKFLFEIKYKEYKQMVSQFEDTTSGLEYLENNKEFQVIIGMNLLASMDLLMSDIVMGMTEEMEKDQIKQNKITSDISLCTYEILQIENFKSSSTKHMSNKEKKIFKKERAVALEPQKSNNKSKLELKIKYLGLNLDKINEEINNKQNNITKFLENKEEYTLSQLNNLHKKYININQNNAISFKKISPSKGIRQYHTFNNKHYSTDNGFNNVNFNFNFKSPVYIELQRILNNSPLNEKTQLEIEGFLNDQGSILLKSRIDKISDINYYRLNPFILENLKKSIGELERLITSYRSNIKKIVNKDKTEIVENELISGLNNEIIISHLLGRLLRIISNNNLFNKNTSCTDLACDLGKSLLYAYYSLKKTDYDDNSLSLSLFIENYYSELKDSASDTVLILIGLKLLNFLEEVGLIHTDIYILSKDHKNLIYVANDNILELIGKNLELLSLSYKIPMIVPPKEYGRDSQSGREILGGYLQNDKEYISPLIIKNSELKEQSHIKNENVIYDTINNLNSVGYKINIPVLEFILEKGLEYELFIDPETQHPLEIKKAQKKKLTLLENKTLDGFLSKKQLEMNILGLALIFKNVPEFFIPVRIDNRGRIYCVADYLNYQGIELSKSLLLFSKGEKINKCDKDSIDYLKIFGANCFGNGIGKKSHNERVEWVNQNETDILDFSNGKLIKEAKSKLLFIAFCFEYQNYHNSLLSTDSFYMSSFPIQLDATCNGYQHLSLLTGDEPLAGQLNLISGDKDSIPNDFYSFVAIKINDYLNNKLSEDKKLEQSYLENKEGQYSLDSEDYKKLVTNIQSCERLLKINKNRSLVKLPIMVKPYNATFFRRVDYLKENFEVITANTNNENGLFEKYSKELNLNSKVLYKDKSNTILNNYDLNLFMSTMEKVIANEFPKLKEFNSYINKIAEICSKLNIPITWVLPSGLNVNQYYIDSEAIRLKPFKFRKNTFNIKVKNNKINKNKQIRALMPNLIHSLDAASLCLIVDMFSQDKSNKINFFAIHDCFAVTANNIVNLIKIIKLVYIKIYSEDSYLKRFDEGIINSIKLQFGNDSFDDKNKTIKFNSFEIDYPNVDEVILGKIKACQINRAQSIIT